MVRRPRLSTVSRVAAGVLGAWLFTAGFIGVGILTLAALGMPYRDAETSMRLLGVVVLLAVFVWAFVETRVDRVWAALVGGGLAMLGAAWWLGRSAH